MKILNIILLLVLISLNKIESQTTTISFSSSGDGYTVSGNSVSISKEGNYELKGSETDKRLVILSNCKIYLNSFSLINNQTIIPILIAGKFITVELVLLGESTLQDTSVKYKNDREGVIFLHTGNSLKISGQGILNLNPRQKWGIEGDDGSSLIVNDGTINISGNSGIGGIYLRKEIIFNNGIYNFNCSKSAEDALHTRGTIKLLKGKFNFNLKGAKGINAIESFYCGEKNGNNNDLELYIKTNKEAIQAKEIEINSGNITIEADEDGINAASVGNECDSTKNCSGNCSCYFTFNGGNLHILSEEDGVDSNGDMTITGGNIIIFSAADTMDGPLDYNGLLKVTGGNILGAGSCKLEKVEASTTQIQKEYIGLIEKGSKLEISDYNGNEILSLNTPKNATYIYFNYPQNISVKLNGNEMNLTIVESIEEEIPKIPAYGNYIKLELLLLLSLLIFIYI